MANVTEKPYLEQARQLPGYEYDVVVAGGGPAGFGAAIGAARAGARTLLIERNSFLGGQASAGLMATWHVPRERLSGASREVIDRLLPLGGAWAGRIVNFDPELYKQVSLEMLEEAGADLLLYSQASAPIVEDGVVRGVIAETKSGRQAYWGRVVDCTGDADLSVCAGAPSVRGRERDSKMRPASILFRLGGVDLNAVADYWRAHPDQFDLNPYGNVVQPEIGCLRFSGFFDLMVAARERGEVDKNIHYLRFEGINPVASTVVVNTTRVYNLDGSDARELTRAEIEARKQMMQLVGAIKKNIPGCQNCYLLDAAVNLGVRETRRVVGEHVFSDQDVAAERVFDDTIAHIWRRSTVGRDMHDPDAGEGLRTAAFYERLKTYDPNYLPPPTERDYYFPYRSLIPKNVEGLLVAGRHMSVDHLGDTWTRGIYCVMTCGQGAGVASAMAAKRGVGSRNVNILELQTELARQKVDLGNRTPQIAAAR